MTKPKTNKKKKTYGKSGGVELTDEVLDKLAAEAEAGYDISQLRTRGRRPMGSGPAAVFQVRLEPELHEALIDRAQNDRTTPSEVVRRVLRRELGVDEPAKSNEELFDRVRKRPGPRPSSKRVVEVIREGRERGGRK